MKINQNFVFWVALSTVSVVFFQNCGQQGAIALKLEDNASDTLVQDICSVNPAHVLCTNAAPVGKVEEYRYIDVNQPVIPDLKIFLVLDNSDSMRVSQVNLISNIEKMFTINGSGLSDYNSEIFITTTAQLNNINNSLFKSNIDLKTDYQKVIDRIHEITSVTYVQSMIDIFRPGTAGDRKTSGLLEGDLVGFRLKSTRTPSAVGIKYDSLNVDFYPAYLSNIDQPSILSVKYSKGESIPDLVEKIKARVEFLDPDRQYLSKSINLGNNIVVDNVPLAEVVEKESGLCAMARVIHEVKNNPDSSLIKKGELATFILVSDEREHDTQGLECVKSYKFQQPVPGNLYKGDCADTDSTVAYKVPSDKTVTVKVRRPYTRHIRQAYEHYKDEITLINGKCDLKFQQSQARLKVTKNTHTVKFDRKIVNSVGNTVVASYTHNDSFTRITRKHDLAFTRTALSHKVLFNRINKKYKILATRTLTAPNYTIDIKRQKIGKYQKVSFSRQTILRKEGGKLSVVDSYAPTAPLRVFNVNFTSSASCTVDWLRALPAVAATETILGANESYQYTVSQCVTDNDVTQDNKVLAVVGSLPTETVCNSTLAKSIYPEPTPAANEYFNYQSVACSGVASTIAYASLDLRAAGSVPTGTACTAALALSLDSGKPAYDTNLGQTLVYSGLTCSDASDRDENQKIENLAGNYNQTGTLEAYIRILDGSKANTDYDGMDKADLSSPESASIANIAGVYSATNLRDYVVLKDGNKPNTTYSNESVTASDTIQLNQTKNGISGQYLGSTPADDLSEVRAQDGSKANTDYSGIVITNIPAYKETKGVTYSLDGKTNTDCTTASYIQNHDPSPPTLLANEYLVYTPISCTGNSGAYSQLVSGSRATYDGVFGNKAIAYEATFMAGQSSRACTDAEKSSIIADDALTIDGNILEFNSCIVSNSDVTAGTSTAKTSILNAINGDGTVKLATNASSCDAAITNYCVNHTAGINSDNLLSCQNNSASFISYRAYEPERRKYTLKAPVKPDGKNELHWFGFEKVTIRNKLNVPTDVDLLSLKCGEVINACEGATAQELIDVTVKSFLMNKYATGSDTAWSAIVKTSNSTETITDPLTIAACDGSTPAGYTTCVNHSVTVSDVLSYDTESNILVSKAFDSAVSCNDLCTSDTCKTKDGNTFTIPYAGKTMKDFYGLYCTVGSMVTTGEANRSTASVRLSVANSDNTAYTGNADVCSLTCLESGLCKLAANSDLDVSTSTVRQYLASKNQNIDASKITSCKIVRNATVSIAGKSSADAVVNECTKPAGTVLLNKYVRNALKYYDADPVVINQVGLVKENSASLEDYIKGGFANVLGDGYVNMVAFTSQIRDGTGATEGADYERVAGSVKGLVRDVKASSLEYGDALKFLGEKVAAQLASSFKVADVDTSQSITRVWYSSWYTKGKFVELAPKDFSASANSFVITNPDIVNKMKNEAAFKFFVEIY